VLKQPWTGVILSRAIATVTQAPTRPIGDGWVVLADGDGSTELFGRDALLADLAADAAAAFELRAPALALLVGDHGVGKTTFAMAVAARIAELDTGHWQGEHERARSAGRQAHGADRARIR